MVDAATRAGGRSGRSGRSPSLLAADHGDGVAELADQLLSPGGAGVADWWGLPHHGKPMWRDLMARIEGPVVAQLQEAFADEADLGGELHGVAVPPARPESHRQLHESPRRRRCEQPR